MRKYQKIILILLTVAVLSATVCFIIVLRYSDIFTSSDSENVNKNYNVKENGYAQILFVGDLMFDRGIRYYAEKNGGNDFIFNEVSSLLLEQSVVVANLEGPITDNKSISAGSKIGSTNNYFFTFDPSGAKTLFTKNIRIVNLGNNHILNFKQSGVDSTKKYLSEAGVSYFGAPGGEKIIIRDINGLKVAFVSYNEFLGSDIDSEQDTVIREIGKAKSDASVDIIVVFCHWGVEYKLTPTEAQRELAKKFIDAGADLVIGSHPHVTQPTEEYKGKRIYYSLGNFVFDQYFNEDVRNGLAVIVKVDKITKELKFEEHALYLQGNGQTIIK